MSIGELAAKSGRSIYTIRWYEAQRLIPGVTRSPGGRRVYSEIHVGWLELLQRLRSTGMSIREMREFAVLVKQGDRTIAERTDFLQLHRKRVDARIAELTEALRKIDDKIEFYREWMAAGRPPKRRQKAVGS
jgi:DNA-binding transcriptional MerR regulator